ncbi:MAG: 3-phosphoshikimate 1-carboxyvinyltransferase [Elusimicrobiota bacterium]
MSAPEAISVRGGRELTGRLKLPGDKSISHRALILGAMAEGETVIENLATGDDVRSTRQCLKALGVSISARGPLTVVRGLGFKRLVQPKGSLDAGNSGTTMRLLMGLVAGNRVKTDITGDSSLRRRPMARVAEPLRKMGARIDLAKGQFAPVRFLAGGSLKGIDYVSPVASAQVKSAVLLAGLLAEGTTSVTEPALSRDHTERMLPAFGVKVEREGLKTSVKGELKLTGTTVKVPGDASSAAFWVVAAAIIPKSDINLLGVGVNPTRTGFLGVLSRMKASINVVEVPAEGVVEPAADLEVRAASLKATDIAPDEVPGLIDEIPVLVLAATQAEGVSTFRGVAELRHKESDRLARVVGLLKKFGADVRIEGDSLIIKGPTPLKGAEVSSAGDHRLAMTALIAGLCAEGETTVAKTECLTVSYPEFLADLDKVWRP